ncbi:MAG: IPExxxVDY family protein [Bacteroidia bacterium]|nr:IPExxxVDY family protein [Bacteroidia bacterium]NND25144.1 IPExxxVDY family protein [Flavobacteriaceae bacterium]MBT8277901.1 IPExxxVDY family protein [Bacteroidia bacterium]NNK61517.1 IPExxxVDY family protein [Flavobacteriaceae bacterium]NNL34148.1 IPExxxVDY family protein [Flavobacteriaceae bacterium]
MALHKLHVDQFYDDSYSLFALHCTLEDYRVAFLLNSNLNIKLKRLKRDLDFEYTTASYAIYEWEDEKKQMTWNLVANICRREEDSLTSSGSLFSEKEKIVRTFNLLPEYKNVNYLLKISSEGNPVNEKSIINKIQNIPQIATVFAIDAEALKSGDHLIFN